MKLRKTTKIIATLLVLLLVFSFAGCGGTSEPAETDNGDGNAADQADQLTFKLGVIAPFSGINAVRGEYIRKGVDYAVKEMAEMAGYENISFDVIYEDTEGDASKATSAAEKLIQKDGVSGLIVSDSGPCLAVLPIATAAEIPMFVTAFSPDLTSQGSDYVFRCTVSDAISGAGLAEYLVSQGYTKIGVAAASSDYGQGAAKPFVAKLKELGVDVVCNETFSETDVDFSAQLINIKKADPEIILVHSYEAAASAFTKQAREMGLDFEIVGITGLASQQYMAAATPEFAEGVKALVAFMNTNQDPMVQEFVQGFVAEYSDLPDHNVARAHAAARIFGEAVKNAGSVGGADVAAAIHGIKDLKLPGGTFTFDEKGEGLGANSNSIGIWKDGKLEFLSTM
ncbi:MAG TPA: ABC transporter substrate-binding protein [Anaerovoracaceae bacterium]|nr:ABC transporter substrate-binding protein [Anaerovoracaceae bacterium]